MPDNSSVMGKKEEQRTMVMEHVLGNSEILKSEKQKEHVREAREYKKI